MIGKECIVRTTGLPSLYKIVSGREDNQLTLSQTAALHYCNWLENNSPSYHEDPDSTDYGTYDLEGSNDILSINIKASYFVPGNLGDDPDIAQVSELGLVLLGNEENPSTKKIPARSLSSINNKEIFSNQDFVKEFNIAQDEQKKWDTYFKKALWKKSKKSADIVREAQKMKISWQQKIYQFEEQLKTIAVSKRDQLTKLIEVHEMILDTVKHTCAILEARIALSKASTFFSTDPEAQEKLETALQLANLSPSQRANELEIELHRKAVETVQNFQEADEAWKLSDSAWQAILDAQSEQQKILRIVQKARVDMDNLNQAVETGTATAGYLVDGFNRIGSILGKLDPKLALPVEGVTEATHLLINGTKVLLNSSIDLYRSHLDEQEAAVTSNIQAAIIQRNAFSAHAEELEQAAIERDRESAIQKGTMAKINSPVSDSLTWKLWKKTIDKSEENLTASELEWQKKINQLEEKLPPIEQELALITAKYKAAVAAVEEATRIRIIKEAEFAAILHQHEITAELTPEKLTLCSQALETAYALWQEQQDNLSLISKQKEIQEKLKKKTLKKLHQTKVLAQRNIARQQALIKSDKAAWCIVWPHRMPPSMDLNELNQRPTKKLEEAQRAISIQLMQQITAIKDTFIQLQSCWERFTEVLSTHLQAEKGNPKAVQKQAELFAKTATTMEDQIATIAPHNDINPFHKIATAASHVVDVSTRLKRVLETMVKEISGKKSASDEALEHQLAFLKTHFSDKMRSVQGTVWIGEIQWSNQIIDKLTDLVNRLREKT
ncbi:MAG: hypothetical protein K2W97_06240 [Chthoniobacterales bacterium]|nr:hypothetical protein [Chthoniobacterales bacterium]